MVRYIVNICAVVILVIYLLLNIWLLCGHQLFSGYPRHRRLLRQAVAEDCLEKIIRPYLSTCVLFYILFMSFLNPMYICVK